jgi:flavodoxin I
MKMAIVYSSRTGNTEELVQYLYELFLFHSVEVELYTVEQFRLYRLAEYDAVVIGTYTWGVGEIPPEMILLYEAFENQNVKHILTGIVGTGDRFYPHFCGAVENLEICYLSKQILL